MRFFGWMHTRFGWRGLEGFQIGFFLEKFFTFLVSYEEEANTTISETYPFFPGHVEAPRLNYTVLGVHIDPGGERCFSLSR